MRKVLGLVVSICLIVPLTLLLAQQYNLSGTWEMTTQSPRGEMKSELEIKQEGTKITVTMKTQRGDITGEGKVEGNKVEWTITRQTPRGEFTTTYKGEIKDKDHMAGEAEMGQFGSIQWSATRKS
ncbi:MAG: hypothetical protein N3B16_00840 [Candidatus Aminicenantes bacterium]|nr:hypothetical protein [Candidatus Aminicenantes bacterium]